MHELAVREAVPAMLADDLTAMREANARFAAALGSGDVEAAVRHAADHARGTAALLQGYLEE